jgi:hypothetical protein
VILLLFTLLFISRNLAAFKSFDAQGTAAVKLKEFPLQARAGLSRHP